MNTKTIILMGLFLLVIISGCAEKTYPVDETETIDTTQDTADESVDEIGQEIEEIDTQLDEDLDALLADLEEI